MYSKIKNSIRNHNCRPNLHVAPCVSMNLYSLQCYGPKQQQTNKMEGDYYFFSFLDIQRSEGASNQYTNSFTLTFVL